MHALPERWGPTASDGRHNRNVRAGDAQVRQGVRRQGLHSTVFVFRYREKVAHMIRRCDGEGQPTLANDDEDDAFRKTHQIDDDNFSGTGLEAKWCVS